MSEKKKGLPGNCRYQYYWESGHGLHGEDITVGIGGVRGYMSSRRAQEICDELIFTLCYTNDLGYPEEEVFV